MASTAGLAEPFKTHVEQLVAASHGRVTVTSGFRTKAEQLALRKKNGCPNVYTSPSRDCDVPTAIPGTSQHEKGLAVDLGGDVEYAARLAPQYGMYRPLLAGPKPEPWHFEPTTTAGMSPTEPQTGGMADKVSAAGGDGEGVVEGLVSGLARITVTGLILAGGLALVAAGAYRSSTGHSITAAKPRQPRSAP